MMILLSFSFASVQLYYGGEVQLCKMLPPDLKI